MWRLSAPRTRESSETPGVDQARARQHDCASGPFASCWLVVDVEVLEGNGGISITVPRSFGCAKKLNPSPLPTVNALEDALSRRVRERPPALKYGTVISSRTRQLGYVIPFTRGVGGCCRACCDGSNSRTGVAPRVDYHRVMVFHLPFPMIHKAKAP